MPEDVVPLEKEGKRKLSAFPESFIGALSAIQEQGFIDSEEVDGDSINKYSQSYTLKHKSHFIKVGFMTGLYNMAFILLGTVFYYFSSAGILKPFGKVSLSLFDKILVYFVNFAPFIVTSVLILRVLKYISGIVARKMLFSLILGFSIGCGIFTFSYLVLSYWFFIKNPQYVYSFFDTLIGSFSFYEKTAFFIQQYFYPIIARTLEKVLLEFIFVSAVLFAFYFFQILVLKYRTPEE